MASQQTSFRKFDAVAGAVLTVIGLFLLFANLDAAAAPVTRDLGISPDEGGSLLKVVLAGLHAVQIFLFNHSAFLSSLRHILISCWPMSLVLFGLVLLRNTIANRFLHYGAAAESTSVGVRS